TEQLAQQDAERTPPGAERLVRYHHDGGPGDMRVAQLESEPLGKPAPLLVVGDEMLQKLDTSLRTATFGQVKRRVVAVDVAPTVILERRAWLVRPHPETVHHDKAFMP